MSLIFLAAAMMADVPSAAPAVPVQQAEAKKRKPAQICEYIEVTGSRSKRRVCRDADGNLDAVPGVTSGSMGGSGTQGSVRAPGGSN